MYLFWVTKLFMKSSLSPFHRSPNHPDEACSAASPASVTTPAKARELGSDYIVVGRPVTQAEDPVAAYERCIKEFLGS